MSIDQSAIDLLEQAGGAPAISWKEHKIGDTVRGTVTGATKRQQSKYKEPETLLFYADGNPMWQLVITIQPPDGGDEFALYAKGQLLKVVKEAIAAAATPKLELGGELAVKWTEDVPSKKGNDQHIFAAKYTSPVAAAAIADDFDDL